ncbi:MAG: diacylglycerol kinase [Candidatus Omnitrophota bacterium]|jgi:diacylglycerol kinase (ATP)
MNSPKKPKHYFDGGFIKSVNTAFEGIVHTLRHERNMRVHFGVGILVLIAGLYFNLSSLEFMILCFTVAFVLVAEMVNTAVEYSIDLINDEYHPLAKVIKDIAAGAVFVSAVNAVIIGYILFARHVQWALNKGVFVRIKQSPWHVTLISLLLIVGLVILIKMVRHERSILRGGMPSGHTAVAFSVWVVVSLVTMNGLASFLTLLLAVLIGRSRMTIKVHTFWEVFLGGVLGTFITLLIFQLLL